VNDFPLNGRRFSDLALFSPGVTQDPRCLTSSTNGDLSFGGIRGFQNTTLVDGADYNNAFFSQARGRYRAPYQFWTEVEQEFRVSTNSYGAEQGRSGEAVVNVVTKSGGNHVHGTAFYYLRDSSFGAADPFLAFKPHNRQQQVGGTIGGPISATRFSSSPDSISKSSTCRTSWSSLTAVQKSCPLPPPCINPLGRPIAQLGAINEFQSAASSYYNGAVRSINRRVARGSYLRFAYTYARAIDDGQDALVVGQLATVQNSYVPSAERGPSVTDQRQRLVVAFSAEPHPFHRRHEFLGQVFNDWKISTVVNCRELWQRTSLQRDCGR
jgi:hypothetical protein